MKSKKNKTSSGIRKLIDNIAFWIAMPTTVLVIFAILYMYVVLPKKQSNLILQYGAGAYTRKYTVPKDIVMSKDCPKFMEWQKTLNIKPPFFPRECPWYTSDDIGEFIINNVEFHIPRKFLWLGRSEPNGKLKEGELFIMIKWEGEDKPLISASSYGDQNYHVNITVQGLKSVTRKIGEREVTSRLSDYYSRAGMIKYKYKDKIGYFDADPIFISHIAKYGVDYYKLPKRGDTNTWDNDFYIVGDVYKPDYWLMCDVSCKTSFALNDNIRVSYGFRKSNFLRGRQHFQLQQKIKELLNGFIQNNKK